MIKTFLLLLVISLLAGCKQAEPKEIEKPGMTVFIKVDTEVGGKIDTGRIFYRNYSGDTTKFDTIHLHGMNWDRPMKEFQAHIDSVMDNIINSRKVSKPMGIRGKSKSYYPPRNIMTERIWEKSVQVKNDTLIRVDDNGIEYYDGKKWITIPRNKYYDSVDVEGYGNHGEKIKP